MTTAEELRMWADKALKEGGIMYFSDEYLDALASRAEAEQVETEKLRSMVRKWYPHALRRVGRDALKQWGQMDVLKELGIEVDDG